MLFNWTEQLYRAWRPINGPVEDFPPAFCDAYSPNPSTDLVVADRGTPHHVGEVYYVVYNENQDWYWLSRQIPDEMTVFISYGSHREIGPACMIALIVQNCQILMITVIPRGTFKIPSAPAMARSRESLEVRMIIIG